MILIPDRNLYRPFYQVSVSANDDRSASGGAAAKHGFFAKDSPIPQRRGKGLPGGIGDFRIPLRLLFSGYAIIPCPTAKPTGRSGFFPRENARSPGGPHVLPQGGLHTAREQSARASLSAQRSLVVRGCSADNSAAAPDSVRNSCEPERPSRAAV